MVLEAESPKSNDYIGLQELCAVSFGGKLEVYVGVCGRDKT